MTKVPQPFPDRAAEYIGKHNLISARDNILVAVSGGPDSVTLLDVLNNLQSRLQIDSITVVHFDHRLRGPESDADREFVRNLACSSGLAFHCGTADVRAFAAERKLSLEMAARECRHAFFRETAAVLKADRIALGHTATDQAEEVLLRLLRGTGPAGIRAMLPRTSEGVIRPLLFATREEIFDYLRSRRLEYRDDSTNSELFCQRNRLRLQIFPLLREAFHPEITKTLARYAELADEEESWWAGQVNRSWTEALGEHAHDVVSLDLTALRKLHPALMRRVLRYGIEKVRGDLSRITALHLQALVDNVASDKPGKSIRFPGEIEALQVSGRLLIRKIGPSAPGYADEEIVISGPGIYEIGPFTFEIAMSNEVDQGSPVPGEHDFVRMDAGKIRWPVHIRFWRPGDRFRPLGMQGSKKLQDFFTDSKIPKENRQEIPLLCDSDKICWVAGLRIDERVKTDAQTKAVMTARLLRTRESMDVSFAKQMTEAEDIMGEDRDVLRELSNR